jgi:hypothetical protein
MILNLVYLNRNRYLAIDRLGGELLKYLLIALVAWIGYDRDGKKLSIKNAFSGGIGEGIFN